MSGVPPVSTKTTFPASGWLSRGEAATADPMIVFGGQMLASKSAGEQRLPSSCTSGFRSGGMATLACTSPASSRSWSIEVVTLVFTELLAPATKALNEGEKSRLPQLSVGNVAEPVAGVVEVDPEYDVAEKVVVFVPHEVGFRMNGLPSDHPKESDVLGDNVCGQSVRRVRDVVDDGVEAEVVPKLNAGFQDDCRKEGESNGGQNDPEARRFTGVGLEVEEPAACQ